MAKVVDKKINKYFAMVSKTIEQISVAPKFKKNPAYKWIPYKYGREYFAEKLYQLRCNSALHNAILTSRTDMVYGAGLIDKNGKPFPDKINNSETFNNVFFKLTADYELYGMAALELIKTAGGSIIQKNHIPWKRIWLGDYTETNEIDFVYYSRDWRLFNTTQQYKPILIPIFKGKMTEDRMIVLFSKYSPGSEYYELPQYIGALKAIELDAQIDNFDLSAIRNGLQPSLVISFMNGDPTKKQKEDLENVITDKYSGSSEAGKVILLFNESKEVAPEIYPVPVNDLDKQYIALNEKATSKILMGHRIPTPMLVGIATAGKLGGSNEMYEGQNIYYETVIKKDQQLLKDIINGTGLQDEIFILDEKPFMYNLSDVLLQRIALINEQRKMTGLKELDESDLAQLGGQGNGIK